MSKRGKVTVAEWELSGAINDILAGVEHLMLSMGIREYSKESISVTRHEYNDDSDDASNEDALIQDTMHIYPDDDYEYLGFEEELTPEDVEFWPVNDVEDALLDAIFGPQATTDAVQVFDSLQGTMTLLCEITREMGKLASAQPILLAGLSTKVNKVQFALSRSTSILSGVSTEYEEYLVVNKEQNPNER